MTTNKSIAAGQVAEVIIESRDVADLTHRLTKRGLRFRSRRQLRRFLNRSWRRAHASEVRKLRSSPVPAETRLVPVEVFNHGVTFRILGAAHGQRRVARMGPKVLEELRSTLQASESPPHSDYATERGFARLLGLPKTKELVYAEAVFRRVGPRGMFGMVIRVVLALPLLPLLGPLTTLSRDPVARELRASLRDPSHIPLLSQLWRVTRLPARIRIELEGNSFSVIHSQEMAKAMQDLALERGLNSLTVLVGLAHADEIAHFLGGVA